MEIWNSRGKRKWRKRIVYRTGKDEIRGWISFILLLSNFFLFFTNTSAIVHGYVENETSFLTMMTKVGHYQFSNYGIWDWQYKVTVNVTFQPFKRLRKIPERKFEKRVHQIPVINVASSACETFMKKVLWFWTYPLYSRYRVKNFDVRIICLILYSN